MAGNGIFAEILDGDVFKYYADGEWKKSNSGKSVPIVNPTTRRTHYKVQGSQIIFILVLFLILLRCFVIFCLIWFTVV